MPVFRDRVKDTTTTTGTGDITLSGTAPLSYRSFNSAFGVNVSFQYCIVDNTSGLWETGLGQLTATTTLNRMDVTDGTSGRGVLVNFTAGTKDVFCTVTSEWCNSVDSGVDLANASGLAMP